MTFRDEIRKSLNHEEELEEKLVNLIHELLIKCAREEMEKIKRNIKEKAEIKSYQTINEKKVISGIGYIGYVPYSVWRVKYKSISMKCDVLMWEFLRELNVENPGSSKYPQILEKHQGIFYDDDSHYMYIKVGANTKILSEKKSIFSDVKTITAQFALDERVKLFLETMTAEAKKDDIELEYGIEVIKKQKGECIEKRILKNNDTFEYKTSERKKLDIDISIKYTYTFTF